MLVSQLALVGRGMFFLDKYLLTHRSRATEGSVVTWRPDGFLRVSRITPCGKYSLVARCAAFAVSVCVS